MSIRTPDMTAHGVPAPSTGITPALVLTAVFKHKWKVLLCTVAGIAGAVSFSILNPPLYQSDAKLLVRYVVERSAVDPKAGNGGDASDKPSDSVLNSEVEILSSWDLFEQVADEIGVNRLCPASKDPSNTEAARVIAAGLTVAVVPRTNVILVSYRNANPDLAPEVLQSLLEAYFSRHLDIHRSKAAFDMVSQQTDMIRAALAKTEDDLKKAKAAANIISVQDTANDLNLELADTERQVNAATTSLAEQRALVNALEKAAPGSTNAAPRQLGAAPAGTPAPANPFNQPAVSTVITSGSGPATADDVEKYQACVAEIAELQKKGYELRATYLPESQPVQLNDAQIGDLQGQLHDMEHAHPDLLRMNSSGNATQGQVSSLDTERARLASYEAGMETLRTRLLNVQARAAEFAKVAPEIQQLERNEQLEQADYASSQSKLENATVDEALDPSKIPNISTVQKPSPALSVAGGREKVILALGGGGLAAGVALALFIEMVLDQTVKRPLELEHRLGAPLLLSIPYVSEKGRFRLPFLRGGKSAANGANTAIVKKDGATVAPWDLSHFIRPYAVAIRDSLGLYFEVNNITHKPKLLAVIGFSEGSGASTLAAGIAAALSETGDGKILLVDMNLEHTDVHPFFQGRPACSLTQALSHSGPPTSAADNLYLATAAQSGNGGGHFGVKRFQELIPYLNASDYDYVLFDMPPLTQTSPASTMAAFMDKVFFVIESEKSQRSLVKRAYTQLLARKADVSVIFNKVRSYAPKWVEGAT